MVVNERPLKRSKSRVVSATDLNDFLTFPGYSIQFTGTFRSIIRSFLARHAHQSPPSSPSLFPNLVVWRILFRIGESHDSPSSSSSPEIVSLDIIEEDVSRSRSVYCDECRVIGWSGHPVCAKRYHFIIRKDISSSSGDGYLKPCTNCGGSLLYSDIRCKSCNYELTAADLEDWLRLQLEDTTHLLHGMVHGNGYGHLLRVNGREGGSRFLSGCDIMDFWDRLCKILGTRKISVMDVSKKYGLEFRLLQAVTNGRTWYGNWGFEFGAGSFNLTFDAYQKAVNTLSEIPLSLFFQARKPRCRVQDLITFYQALSERQLSTIKELFCFLMGLISKTGQNQVGSKGDVPCSSMVCRDDIERVQESMIKVLQVAGGTCWVSWRALKGATSRLAAPEILDYCLKALGGKVLDDGRMILSRCNPESDAIEYRLVSMDGALAMVGSHCPSKDHILRDLKFLYDALLNPHSMLTYRPQPTREGAVASAMKLLDCKQFVKNYESERVAITNPFILGFSCQVELTDLPADYTAPPPELIFVPLNATLADLKFEVAKVFHDLYLLFKKFQVDELLGYGDVDETSQIKFLIGSSGLVRLRGRLLQLEGLEHFRMERGVESWIVNCTCGAKDDDGERMLACDSCGTWQHTRCVGINDLSPVPERFLCFMCNRIKTSTTHLGTGSGRGGNRSRLDNIIPSRSSRRTGGKSKEKMLALSSKTGLHPCRSGIKWGEPLVALPSFFPKEIESPTQSGASGISNCKEEDNLDVVQTCLPKINGFGTVKNEPQEVDACFSKMGSPNPSGITSDETSVVLDTCSSDNGLTKHANKFDQETDEAPDTCRIGNGLTIRFRVR